MEFRRITTPADYEKAFVVMKELRTHLSYEEFFELALAARSEGGYQMAGYFSGPQCVAVIGYRLLHDFVHGHHCYVDDLVTTKDLRSQGVGAKLLSWCEGEAQAAGCKGIRLCTGIENEAGKRFYERHGWNLRAVVYKKKF